VSWTHSPSFSSPSFTLSAPAALYGGQGGSSNPSAFAETYTIDPWGNQTESGSFNFIQSFSSNNQISGTGYTYDTAGDLKTDGLGNTYTYNVNGMLIASNGVQYLYDALNQRVDKVGGPNPGETIYFGGRPIALWNTSTHAWTDLIWAGAREIATVPGTQTATPTFRLLDHEGSLVMTTDASGNVTGSNVLSPYGQTISSNTSDAYSYASLNKDTEYGGDAATFRNYSESQLRWTRPDPYNGSYNPSNPQSMNRYTYVMDNPLALTDPSGLDCVYDEGGGWVAVVQGDCASPTDDGYYIDATINTSGGFTLAPDGSLNFGTIWSDGATGIGSIPGFADNVPNASSPDPWDGNTLAQQTFQGLRSGVFVAADKVVHGLAIATAGAAAVPFVVPTVAGAATTVPLLGETLYLDPKAWQVVGDFLEGATPGLYPATYAAGAGAVISGYWDDIWSH